MAEQMKSAWRLERSASALDRQRQHIAQVALIANRNSFSSPPR